LVSLNVKVYAQVAEARVGHLPDRNGRHEVDLIVEGSAGRVVALEVKLAAVPDDHDVRHLLWLKERLGSRVIDLAVVTTGGPRLSPPGRRRGHPRRAVGAVRITGSAARLPTMSSPIRSMTRLVRGARRAPDGSVTTGPCCRIARRDAKRAGAEAPALSSDQTISAPQLR